MTLQTSIALPDSNTAIKAEFDRTEEFQAWIQDAMREGHDYGKIPGTQNPTLLKPGAEKLVKLLKLAPKYEIVEKSENWESQWPENGPFPLFAYTFRCILVTATESPNIPVGTAVDEGYGNCNSYENRYRYRKADVVCPQCGKAAIIRGKAEYGGGWLCFSKKGGCNYKWSDQTPEAQTFGDAGGKTLNEDIHTQVNTLIKMAKKRALVDAALSAGRLSDLFTQDMEDIRSRPPIDDESWLGQETPEKPAEEKPKPKREQPETLYARGPVASQKKGVAETSEILDGQGGAASDQGVSDKTNQETFDTLGTAASQEPPHVAKKSDPKGAVYDEDGNLLQQHITYKPVADEDRGPIKAYAHLINRIRETYALEPHEWKENFDVEWVSDLPKLAQAYEGGLTGMWEHLVDALGEPA
jgi:ssDNA-binding Zn-finger/Zn-ribbon topoisomerase 1